METIASDLRLMAHVLEEYPKLVFMINKIKGLYMSASKFDNLDAFLEELRYELYGDEMGGQ